MQVEEAFKHIGMKPTSNLDLIRENYSVMKSSLRIGLVSVKTIAEKNEAYFIACEYARNELRFVKEAIYLSFKNE